MPVKRSNFTLVFFKAACHAKPAEIRKRAGSCSYISTHIFQHTYHLKHTNHDILLNVLFINLYKFFFHGHNLHQ